MMNNERLIVLANECTSYKEGLIEGKHDIEVFDKEKFAELIVRECLDIASEVRGEPATDTHFVIGYDRACEKMIDGIKEHFGVEQ
jgi:hypothetical protein